MHLQWVDEEWHHGCTGLQSLVLVLRDVSCVHSERTSHTKVPVGGGNTSVLGSSGPHVVSLRSWAISCSSTSSLLLALVPLPMSASSYPWSMFSVGCSSVLALLLAGVESQSESRRVRNDEQHGTHIRGGHRVESR